jgi:hypothetical protein
MTDDGFIEASVEKGRGLFNEGRYFEAHEAWEEAWRVETGDARRLLQGLIQIASGCHKAAGGQRGGCVRLLEAGHAKLASAVPGTSLAAFRDAIGATLARARSWETGGGEDIGAIPPLGPAGRA